MAPLRNCHHKHTKKNRVILSIIPCIDSSFADFIAVAEFADAILSEPDSGSDSSAGGRMEDWPVNGSVSVSSGGSSGGPDGVEVPPIDVLLLTMHMRQKRFPLDPIWQANSLCKGCLLAEQRRTELL